MFRRFMPSWIGGGSSNENGDNATTGGSSSSSTSKPKKGSRRSKRSNPAVSTVEESSNIVIVAEDESSEVSDPMDELEIINFSPEQKDILKSSWKVIYAQMGYSLSYVGSSGDRAGVADTFLRLFEEYPKSQEFFFNFRDTPVAAIREDLKLSKALEEHAVRVMQVVEKVIGRLDTPEKGLKYLLNLGKFHRHSGIPSDYFGVMGTIFLHAVRPYLEESGHWNEATEDVWMELFAHIARVMTHGHKYYHIAHIEDLKVGTSAS